jgi:hypothetical protein
MRKLLVSIAAAAGLLAGALGADGAAAAPVVSQAALAAASRDLLPTDQVRYRRTVAPRRAPRVVYKTVYRTRYVYVRKAARKPLRRHARRWAAPWPGPSLYESAPVYIPPTVYPDPVYEAPAYYDPPSVYVAPQVYPQPVYPQPAWRPQRAPQAFSAPFATPRPPAPSFGGGRPAGRPNAAGPAPFGGGGGGHRHHRP